ncbi:hypothetical protein K505DRAFT_358888 [Melanomma pulvis-pyrius CBS 109.77]|uniref:MARVEL domain-containing protein n=1 Tax=Melanomma pulvis-pyrius CBS 109.77 TaxID=1314802 RepID=A0A6A6XK60_9PLEO|nr:hypothetical protein K505DRAFT_358888 [Melanomma pulvis-pyrius CBS 109.77]
MAGPLLNLTIFTKSTAHTLRAISIATFPPAFLILLIQGIVSHGVLPALGILPLFFSSAFSALLLANEKKCGCQSSGLTGTPIHFVFDVLLAIGLLVLLILTWIFLPDSSGEMIMLGTYGTNFLLCNFLVHVYFTAQQLSEAIAPGASYPSSCPQCQYGPFTVAVKRGVRGGYEPLLDGEGAPRASVDEDRNEGDSAV